MNGRQTSVSEVALAWAWAQSKDRRYPANIGIVLVYMATKARRMDDGEWVTFVSHGELAEVSGSRIETVRNVMKKLFADGLIRTAPRTFSRSRTQRAYFIAVAEKGA